MEIGDPYNVVFSNKVLESSLNLGPENTRMMQDNIKLKMKGKKNIFRDPSRKKKFKTFSIWVGSFFVFIGYTSLMLCGAFVILLLL